MNRVSVGRDQDVAGFDPRLRGGTVLVDRFDDEVIFAVAVRGIIDGFGIDHAEFQAVVSHLSDGLTNHSLGDLGDDVDGNREGDILRLLAHSGVQSDHLAVDVDQRAARIAGIDRGVRLDNARVGKILVHFERTIGPANDAARHGAAVSVRIADRVDVFGKLNAVGTSHANLLQRLLRLNLQDRQIGGDVVAHQLHVAITFAVRSDYFKLEQPLHHVVISQDIPSFVDDDSRSHAVKNVVMSAASRRSWTRLILLFALNAHDRLANLVDDIHETRSLRARPTLLRRLFLGG